MVTKEGGGSVPCRILDSLSGKLIVNGHNEKSRSVTHLNAFHSRLEFLVVLIRGDLKYKYQETYKINIIKSKQR